MSHAVMGIDPGVRGGLAVLNGAGVPLIVHGFNPKMTQRDLIDCVHAGVTCLITNGGFECFCEKVGYMPGDGGRGANTFGRVDGLLRGAVLALGVRLHDVSPMMWQSRLDCMSGGNKNVTKNKAISLFANHDLKITHAIADALLIAEFGRRSQNL